MNIRDVDCSKYARQDLVANFTIEYMFLGEQRFQKYLKYEEEYYDELIELQTKQIKDTLIIKFYRLGGGSTVNCIGVTKEKSKINIINYESDYFREISIREFNYRIINTDQLKLGTIDFK
ncbi:MAG: hypothetical protein AB8F74_04775 [Saprospiraceae bacterium]